MEEYPLIRENKFHFDDYKEEGKQKKGICERYYNLVSIVLPFILIIDIQFKNY